MMVMWVFLFVLVVTDTSEAVEADGDCSLPSTIACEVGDLLNFEGGLHSLCRTLLEKVECMIRVEEKCHSNPYVLEIAKKQLPGLKRSCGGEREGLVTNFAGSRENIPWTSMQCIKNVLEEKRGYCVSTSGKFKLINYAKALIKKGIISDVLIETQVCIGGLNAFTCLAFNVEKKCGIFAFNQYIKVMESMSETIMSACGDLQYKDVFPTMLKVYKENEQAENLLWNVLKTPGL